MLSSVYVNAAWRFSGASADIHRQTGTTKIDGCVLNLCRISRGWHSAQKEAERKTDRKQRQRGFRRFSGQTAALSGTSRIGLHNVG